MATRDMARERVDRLLRAAEDRRRAANERAYRTDTPPHLRALWERWSRETTAEIRRLLRERSLLDDCCPRPDDDPAEHDDAIQAECDRAAGRD